MYSISFVNIHHDVTNFKVDVMVCNGLKCKSGTSEKWFFQEIKKFLFCASKATFCKVPIY